MTAVPSLDDISVAGKRVLLREDLNVPLSDDGVITSDVRLQRALPTIEKLIKDNAAVLLLSHLGRPTEGEFDEKFSLKPVADYLSKYFNKPVRLEKNWLDGVDVASGEVVLCENVRFNVGEKSNSPELAQKIAKLADIFVMDAFATSHRAQASTVGVTQFIEQVVAGPLFLSELNALQKILETPKKPILAIIGGAKVSTKLDLISNIIAKVDYLILGGGIANTFLAANGHNIGRSLHEADLIPKAKDYLAKAKEMGCEIILPLDAVVATEISDAAQAYEKAFTDITSDEMILDVGQKTSQLYDSIVSDMATILWNGPVGVFEKKPFANGTKRLAQAIAKSQAYSVAGGGDTVAAIDVFNLQSEISYISTAGGAFLELMEGKTLPAISALEKNKI